LEFGFGKVCITPKIGTRLIGQPEQLESNGKYTDLYARSLYLKSAENEVIITSCDLLFFPKSVADFIREEIFKRTSVKVENIIIHTTHTHAGPSVTTLFGEDNVDSEVSKKIYEGIIASGVASFKKRREGFISVGRDYRYDLAFNRRYIMKDGSVELHPHKDDPNILQAEGPSDPEINILFIRDKSKCPVGALASFSCHLTSLERDNRKFSADFPAFAEKNLMKYFKNEDFILIYLNGPCGNICQVNVENRGTIEAGIEHTKKMGKMFSESVLKALLGAEALGESIPIKTKYREIHIPIRHISEEMIVRAKNTVKKYQGKNLWLKKVSNYGIESYKERSVISANKFLETKFWKNAAARELLKLHNNYKNDNHEIVPLTIISIGEILIATTPAELFIEFSLELKEKFKNRYKCVFIVELVNGWIGYVPTKKAFQPAVGGYEVQFLNSSKLHEDAGEIIVDELIKMEKEL
jgi:hypothetical protein